ncbi:LysR family transcriptional regulator [Secundilactobacillus muriivasis]
MNFVRLKCFVAVAKYGSMTEAASMLFMTEPSISFQITQLEKEIGTPLLERSYHHIELTLAGKIFQQTAQTILDTYQDGLLKIQHSQFNLAKDTPPLTLETYVTPGLKSIQTQIKQFLRFFPEITVNVRHNSFAETLSDLRQHRCDLATSIVDDSPDLNWIPIMKDRYVIAYPTTLERQSFKPADLNQLTEISYHFNTDSHFGPMTTRIRQQLELTSPQISTDSLLSLLIMLSTSTTPSYAFLPQKVVDQRTFDLTYCPIPQMKPQACSLTIGWAYLKSNQSELTQLFNHYCGWIENIM